MSDVPKRYSVTWSKRASDKLARAIRDARRAQGNLEWVKQKFEECLREGVDRLHTFPDLRPLYIAGGHPCNAITLRAFPIQVFFRLTKSGDISIFSCRWSRQDAEGPTYPPR